MDYILCDNVIVQEEDNGFYTEAPYRLPDSYLCFTPSPQEDAIEVNKLPALENSGITFGCFNQLKKMNDEAVRVWAQILKAIPGSRLILKTPQLDDDETQRRTFQRFEAQGIAIDRLSPEGGAPQLDVLQCYRRVDIALDPFPYVGSTTTVESLWMGVPVISMSGDCFLHRVGESILQTTGLMEWVATNKQEYIDLAVTYAANISSLANLREGLRDQLLTSPLCDAPRFARTFEIAMKDM